jgi:hypothetical protein
VLEWAVLRLHGRLAADPEWGRVPLAELFTNMLGVPAPEEIVGPAVDALLNLGVFTAPRPRSPLARLTPADLKLTPLGEELIRSRLLPGRERTDRFIAAYDPVSDRLLDRADRLADQPPTFHFAPPPDLAEQYPRALIETRLRERPPEWLSASGQLHDVERERVDVRYRSRDVSVTLDAGELRLEADDPIATAWLAARDGTELIERFLVPALGDERTANLPRRETAELAGAAGLLPLPRLAERLSAGSGVQLLASRPGLLPAPAEPVVGTVRVHFDPEEPADGLAWAEDRGGAVLRVRAPFPDPDGLGVCPDGTLVRAGVFGVRVNGAPHDLSLVSVHAGPEADRIRAEALELAGKAVLSFDEPSDWALLLEWRLPAEAFATIAARIEERRPAPAEAVSAWQRVREAAGRHHIAWEWAFADWVVGRAAADPDGDRDAALSQLAEAVRPVRLTGPVARRVAGALRRPSAPPAGGNRPRTHSNSGNGGTNRYHRNEVRHR